MIKCEVCGKTKNVRQDYGKLQCVVCRKRNSRQRSAYYKQENKA